MSAGCEVHADALADLAAGRLETARAAGLEEHLATCAECREDLDVLKLVHRAEVTPPVGLEERVRAAARHAAGEARQGSTGARTPARQRSGWRPWVLPLAAAAGVAAVWLGVLDRRTPSDDLETDAVTLAAEAPFGTWPATGPEIAGDPVLSELSAEDLELLLEEMEP